MGADSRVSASCQGGVQGGVSRARTAATQSDESPCAHQTGLLLAAGGVDGIGDRGLSRCHGLFRALRGHEAMKPCSSSWTSSLSHWIAASWRRDINSPPRWYSVAHTVQEEPSGTRLQSLPPSLCTRRAPCSDAVKCYTGLQEAWRVSGQPRETARSAAKRNSRPGWFEASTPREFTNIKLPIIESTQAVPSQLILSQLISESSSWLGRFLAAVGPAGHGRNAWHRGLAAIYSTARFQAGGTTAID